MKYLSKQTELVEPKIADLFPSRIALVFDGWSSNIADTIYDY